MSSDREPPPTDVGPEPWTRFDHPGPVALDYVAQWCLAVDMQARRVLETPGGIARWSEAALLVVALNNAERAARFASANASSEAALAIAEALKRFEAAVPGVASARNMIEHFDAYERGIGDAQQPGIRRRRREADKAAAGTFSVVYVGSDRNLLEVGPYRINVARARDGASELRDSVHEALRVGEQVGTSET